MLTTVSEQELDSLIGVIRAVDRLNSCARAIEYRQQLGSGIKAIYWLKKQAIRAAKEYADFLNVRHRRIKVEVGCNRCEDGEYFDEYGYPRGPCYHCNRGLATLHFVETRIGDAIAWHSPAVQFPLSLEETLDGEEELVEDWQPNTPGKMMEPWEIAACFNTAEPYLVDRYRPKWKNLHWYEEYRYFLDIGRVTPGECCLCGLPGNHLWHNVASDRLQYHAPVCDGCCKRAKNEVRDLIPFPYHLVHHPEIQKWIQRKQLEAVDD